MAKTNIFQQLVKEVSNARLKGKAATEWLRREAQKTKSVNVPGLMWSLHEQMKSQTVIGSCYLFSYSPKYAKELPYWDKYPVIFPIGKQKGRMLGINLHYLPYTLRAVLMDALYSNLETNKKSENLRLKISYQILMGFSKHNLVKPTIHSYLGDHVTSNFIKIPASEWDIAIFLPLQRFQKSSAEKVWAESVRKIG